MSGRPGATSAGTVELEAGDAVCGRSFANLFWFWGDGRAQCQVEIGWRRPACPSPPASRQREESEQTTKPTQSGKHNRVTLPLKIPPLGHSGCHDELQEHDPNQQETLSDESTACVHIAPSAVSVVAPLFLARGICSNETCSNDPISIPEGEISFRCFYTWASPAIRVRRPTHPNTLTSRLDQVDFSDMLRPLWRL